MEYTVDTRSRERVERRLQTSGVHALSAVLLGAVVSVACGCGSIISGWSSGSVSDRVSAAIVRSGAEVNGVSVRAYSVGLHENWLGVDVLLGDGTQEVNGDLIRSVARGIADNLDGSGIQRVKVSFSVPVGSSAQQLVPLSSCVDQARGQGADIGYGTIWVQDAKLFVSAMEKTCGR